ncbi:MAG: hypothetical protein AAFV07_12990 [Bacteroidota bacterium]
MYKVVAYLGLIMGVFFVFSGLLIAYTKFLQAPPPIFQYEFTAIENNLGLYNALIGALVAAYGIFRVRRSFKLIREN